MTPVRGPRPKVSLLAAALLLPMLSGCSRDPAKGLEKARASDAGRITLEKVAGRGGASEAGAVLATLTRGTEIRILGAEADFFRVAAGSGPEVWVPAGAFETEDERQARERRAQAVSGFSRIPGRAIERCPVLLAPDYGAARWGELDDGDDLEVFLADHDFYGVRLGTEPLLFVPARSVRLLPAPVDERGPVPTPGGRRGPAELFPEVGMPEPAPGEARGPDSPIAVPFDSEAMNDASRIFESVPPGASAPVLISRVDPIYPEFARRRLIGGDVTLQIVVDAQGRVGDVRILKDAPAGLGQAATEAVRRWTYRPARFGDRPIAVWVTVLVRFKASQPSAGESPPL